MHHSEPDIATLAKETIRQCVLPETKFQAMHHQNVDSNMDKVTYNSHIKNRSY